MIIPIKTKQDIDKMRLAGGILARLDKILESHIAPGVSTAQLDKIAEDYIRSQGALPSFKGYGGFPGAICTSVNDEIIHGIPGNRVLKEGDIISIDMGSYLDGFHGDMARTYPVGNITQEAQKLIEVTRQSFFEGLRFVKDGCYLKEVSAAIQNYVEANGFSIVREYVGHGIGRNLHEAPEVPNYVMHERSVKLKNGMTIAIEPMVNMGGAQLFVQKDGWTVKTKDGQLSAHYENTVAVTTGEPEILTILS